MTEDGPGGVLQLLRRAVPPGAAAQVLALSLLVALLEGLGVLLLVPLLALVGIELGGGATTAMAEAARAVLTSLRIPITLASVLVVYVTVVAVQAAVGRVEAIAAVRVRETVAARMRQLLYGAIARMRWRSFIERHSSVYVHALTSQLDRAQLAFSQSMALLSQALVALVYVVVALRVAPALSAVALAGGALLLLLTRRYSHALQASGTELNAATQRLQTTVIEHLSNMKVARSFGAERQHIAHFNATSDAVVSSWAATGAAFAGSRWVFTVGAAVMLAGVVYAGVTIFGLDAAAILLLLYVFGRLVPRAGVLQQLLHQIAHALPALRATVNDLETYEEAAEPELDTDATPLPLNDELTFERVAFGYVDGQRVLDGVTFRVPARQVTVLAGHSGAGKTTIADLVLGLLEPSEGSIQVDGRELSRETARLWRHSVAYVPQEAVLFNDTVRNNLLWAVPEAGDTELENALAAAQADFVNAMPGGLDTVVGERGAWLSGGERQRLAIARALLRKPRLLVLDEPTSSLDAGNERRILEVIGALRGSVTVLIISHRDSVLAVADQILLLKDGRITSEQSRSEPMHRSAAAIA
ncbi:MAG TPA: ABC transporter ATP-binding protein [Gemmatimonadaceae bacterium]